MGSFNTLFPPPSGGGGGGGAVTVLTDGSGAFTDIPSGGVAVLSATEQYYNITSATISVPVQATPADATTYFGTTNVASWTKVGDGGFINPTVGVVPVAAYASGTTAGDADDFVDSPITFEFTPDSYENTITRTFVTVADFTAPGVGEVIWSNGSFSVQTGFNYNSTAAGFGSGVAFLRFQGSTADAAGILGIEVGDLVSNANTEHETSVTVIQLDESTVTVNFEDYHYATSNGGNLYLFVGSFTSAIPADNIVSGGSGTAANGSATLNQGLIPGSVEAEVGGDLSVSGSINGAITVAGAANLLDAPGTQNFVSGVSNTPILAANFNTEPTVGANYNITDQQGRTSLATASLYFGVVGNYAFTLVSGDIPNDGAVTIASITDPADTGSVIVTGDLNVSGSINGAISSGTGEGDTISLTLTGGSWIFPGGDTTTIDSGSDNFTIFADGATVTITDGVMVLNRVVASTTSSGLSHTITFTESIGTFSSTSNLTLTSTEEVALTRVTGNLEVTGGIESSVVDVSSLGLDSQVFNGLGSSNLPGPNLAGSYAAEQVSGIQFNGLADDIEGFTDGQTFTSLTVTLDSTLASAPSNNDVTWNATWMYISVSNTDNNNIFPVIIALENGSTFMDSTSTYVWEDYAGSSLSQANGSLSLNGELSASARVAGNLTVTDSLIITSPNGTLYEIEVSDTGLLSATAVI